MAVADRASIAELLLCSETYSYYDLPFCQPSDGVKYKTLTHVGEVIDSNKDANTAYNLPFRAIKQNTLLCAKQLTVDEVDKFRKVRGHESCSM